MLQIKLIQLYVHFNYAERLIGAPFDQLQKRRERGKVNIRGIKLVEPAILHGGGGDTAAPDVSIFVQLIQRLAKKR